MKTLMMYQLTKRFLKYLGFSTPAAVLASCEGPSHKSVPYVIQPEESGQVLQIIMQQVFLMVLIQLMY